MISVRARCSGDAAVTDKVDDGVALWVVDGVTVLVDSPGRLSGLWPPQAARPTRATATNTAVEHLAAVIISFLDLTLHKEFDRLWRSGRMVGNASGNFV